MRCAGGEKLGICLLVEKLASSLTTTVEAFKQVKRIHKIIGSGKASIFKKLPTVSCLFCFFLVLRPHWNKNYFRSC